MTRNGYYHNKIVYEHRRQKLKRVLSKNLTSLRHLTYKINSYQKAINRIDERNEKIHRLYKKINYYFNVNIKSASMDMEHKLARQVYFKIGMENKMQGKNLAEYIGKSKRSAFRNRLSLTRSFAANTKNKEVFHAFKKFIHE